MNKRIKDILLITMMVIVILCLLFWGLAVAQDFLAPLAMAALLAMVVYPISNWQEKMGIGRGWSSLWSTLIILLFCVFLGMIVGLQVRNFTNDWPNIKQTMEPLVEDVQNFVSKYTGVSPEQQEKEIKDTLPIQLGEEGEDYVEKETKAVEPEKNGIAQMSSYALTFFGIVGNFLLTFIYVFFFLLYRKKFRRFLLRMSSDENRDKMRKILTESLSVSQHYLFGRLILILFLAILYSIGLYFSGVQQAILISVLAALLSLLPFIGNVLGYFLALGMALISGVGAYGVIGVTITFSITQFVETYILEPYIVGNKVHINPVFTVVVVVLGGMVWGITGMFLAIPVLGIVKVVLDRIPAMEPFGYLLGETEEDDEQLQGGFFQKVKDWASENFRHKND
jgi:predicted PurR-regulated permease PerM